MKQNDYVKACLELLIPRLTGLTITGGAVDASGEYWGFRVRDKDAVEKTVFVLADPEGNGPGFLEIRPSEQPDPPARAAACGCVHEAPEEPSAVVTATAPRFRPGQVVATPGALTALGENETDCSEYLGRHLRGDWGELDLEDSQANDEALKEGLRLLSAYRLSDGTKIWIITEADRSVMTVLLPEEY